MGEFFKIGFDTYTKTESKVKVVIDDGQEVVGITLFFQNLVKKIDEWFLHAFYNVFFRKSIVKRYTLREADLLGIF